MKEKLIRKCVLCGKREMYDMRFKLTANKHGLGPSCENQYVCPFWREIKAKELGLDFKSSPSSKRKSVYR